jgi:O-antigen/teichoic acid export membrane protein
MVLGLGRSVLMARLLRPEDFGVVAFAMTFLNFTAPLRSFGLDQALIHRKIDEESSLDEVLAVHFSLRLILMGLFLLLLLAAIPVLHHFYPHKTMLIPVLLVLTVGEIAIALGSTHSAYLRKAMRFKELAVLQVLTSFSMTIVGPLMAWQGWGVWAIVAERISGVIIAALAIWTLIRPWSLRWQLKRKMAIWYLNYGKFIFATGELNKFINEFDDFWVGTVLGAQSLGFYSKAFEFSNYPRRVISDPLAKVLFPSFSRAQDDRLRLSKAYFRTSSLIIRAGFLFAGSLALGASVLIPFILGQQWVPMTLTFQLMIIYALLDPLLAISINLVTAVGHPEFITRARFVQGLFFVPAVIGGAYWGGTNGVAFAADFMLLMGLILVLYQSQRLVDISFRKMLGPPSSAVLVGGLAYAAIKTFSASEEVITTSCGVLGYVVGYCAVLLILERQYYVEQLEALVNLFASQKHRTEEDL